MNVFRLCNKDEIDSIIDTKDISTVGKEYTADPIKNNHHYIPGKKYLHFFGNETSLLFLNTSKGNFICVYDIPDDILESSKGIGKYADFITFSKIMEIPEYAIPSEQVKLNSLKKVYMITEDIDFEYYPEKDEIYHYLKCIVDVSKKKSLPTNIDIEK